MRVVLDTNILVRAANGYQGLARELLNFCGRPPHVLLVSESLLAELERVLRYPRVRATHRLSDVELDQFVTFVREAGVVIEVSTTTRGSVCMDPDDDSIIDLAVVGRAHVLCTLDRHLRTPAVTDFCKSAGVSVMTDVELIRQLRPAP
jgi:uncharacterized protein